MVTRIIVVAVLAGSCVHSEARIPRSHAAIDAFKRAHACPSTGRPRGRCRGYIIDHVIPLCAHGADAPRNMQWQTVAAAKVKDRGERRECAALRRKAR